MRRSIAESRPAELVPRWEFGWIEAVSAHEAVRVFLTLLDPRLVQRIDPVQCPTEHGGDLQEHEQRAEMVGVDRPDLERRRRPSTRAQGLGGRAALRVEKFAQAPVLQI